jgi:hypothetical protein
MKCWECEIQGVPLHNHHPVPKSRGGTKTIPLCELCHSKAHHRENNMATSALTKEGLKRAKAKGVQLGNPKWGDALPTAWSNNKQNADDFALSMEPIIKGITDAGATTYQDIANALNARGIKTRSKKPGAIWYPSTVRNTMVRAEALKK